MSIIKTESIIINENEDGVITKQIWKRFLIFKWDSKTTFSRSEVPVIRNLQDKIASLRNELQVYMFSDELMKKEITELKTEIIRLNNECKSL